MEFHTHVQNAIATGHPLTSARKERLLVSVFSVLTKMKMTKDKLLEGSPTTTFEPSCPTTEALAEDRLAPVAVRPRLPRRCACSCTHIFGVELFIQPA